MTRSKNHHVICGLVVVLAAGWLPTMAGAAELHVPGDFATIQAALNAANPSDEIIVAPGTYHEAINFLGKAVYLHSSDGPAATIIDATGLNTSVVTCASGEGPGTILEGFTVTGGRGTPGQYGSLYGGGMYNVSSSPTVTNCTFSGNRANSGGGGGMYNYRGNPTVTGCTFSGNYTLAVRGSGRGGGMYNSNSSPSVTNCTFSGNGAYWGGGMRNSGGSPTVTNCTFSGNSADEGGGMDNSGGSPTVTNCTFRGNRAARGGGMCNSSSNPTVTNCILWGNTPDEISGDAAAVTCSDVQGGYPGTGNIEADPLFIDFANGDFRLAGGSPCIDAGTNAALAWGSDADGNCRIMDGNGNGSALVDMGAFEAFGAVLDCNGDGVCDTQQPAESDCNHNFIPDACDTGGGWSPDCNGNGIPDECGVGWEHDCNGNGVPDFCDIDAGTSQDCNGNGIPDECDLANGFSQDCNQNEVPDECDIANGTSLDELPPGGDGIPDDCGWVHNVTQDTYYLQIQAALDAAGDGDEIIVAPGTYPEAINFHGKAVYLHSSDGPTVTIIDATGLNASVVTCASGEEPDTVLEGFTMTGGAGTPDQYGLIYGGGMYNDASSPTVTNCTFDANGGWDLTWGGGGMCNWGGSSPTVTNCTFSGNSAHCGAGMYNENSSPTVTNCTFSGNSSAGYVPGFGGGMYNHAGSNPAVTNCTFSGNVAAYGGAIYGGSPTVTGCTFSGNSGHEGGAMYNTGGSPTVTDCTFNLNSVHGGWADSGGGAMYNDASSATVTGCTFSGNSADTGRGGGMYNYAGSPVVTNCTFSGNVADYGGGGMTNWDSSPTVTDCTFGGNWCYNLGGGMGNSHSSPTVTSCTFSGNWGHVGGGMYNAISSPTVTNCTFAENTALHHGGGMGNGYSSPTLTNCTFSGNSADYGGGMTNYASSPTVTSCIFWGDTLEEIYGDAAAITYSDVQGGYAGTGNIDADPLFVRPPSDGGDGWGDNPDTPHINEAANDDYGDLHLTAGSPCIDAGDNTAVPAWLLTDLDGRPRCWDDPDTPDTGNPDGVHPLVDMGPYEFGSEGCPDDDGDGFVTLCHIPPGHPERARTITLPAQATPTHLAHGDYCGPCGGQSESPAVPMNEPMTVSANHAP